MLLHGHAVGQRERQHNALFIAEGDERIAHLIERFDLFARLTSAID